MNCPQCGRPLVSRRENHRYLECGLPHVTLRDVEQWSCGACGEHLVDLPRIEQLHQAMALLVVHQRARLRPSEIRFLRKFLGWSGAEFARYLAVAPETVAAWEREADPEPMGEAAERLLRLMAATMAPGEFPLARLLEVGLDDPRPVWLQMSFANGSWKGETA